MSTLDAEIKTAQADAPPPVPEPAEAMDERPPGLLIYQWDETEWVLSWAYFIRARYRPRVKRTPRPGPAPDNAIADATIQSAPFQNGAVQGNEPQSSAAQTAASMGDTVEQIELTFADDRVVIQGRNLKQLMPAIADMSLCIVRELSPDFAEMQPLPAHEAPEIPAAGGTEDTEGMGIIGFDEADGKGVPGANEGNGEGATHVNGTDAANVTNTDEISNADGSRKPDEAKKAHEAAVVIISIDVQPRAK